MQALEKNTAVVGTVKLAELLPSKRPDWDSRWVIEFSDGYRFYVGNKAFVQQTTRLNLQTKDLFGKTIGFERTDEGYLNIVLDGASFRAGTRIVHRSAASDMPAHEERNPNRFDGNEVPDAPHDAPDQTEVARGNAVAAMQWAMTQANAMVRELAGVEPEKPTPAELMRSVVALAATLHITVKGNGR